ncbi:hypothetical protein ACF0H5_011950 [Mactra antiquata]
MNKLAFIGILCLASYIGMALGTMTYSVKHPYNYMSYGYGSYMPAAVGTGAGATGGLIGGLGGIFELIIFMVIFVMIINMLTGTNGIIGSIGGGSNSRDTY